uniref:Uncharacterized protein n=1 Tax=Anguilla anguilla TaxID=7936 RepID=A0A0E9VF36_ANGAN
MSHRNAPFNSQASGNLMLVVRVLSTNLQITMSLTHYNFRGLVVDEG